MNEMSNEELKQWWKRNWLAVILVSILVGAVILFVVALIGTVGYEYDNFPSIYD